MSAALHALAWAFAWAITGMVVVCGLYAMIDPDFATPMWRRAYRILLRISRGMQKLACTKALAHRPEGGLRDRIGLALFKAGACHLDPRMSHWLSVRAGVLCWMCTNTRFDVWGPEPSEAAMALLHEHAFTDEEPSLSSVCS